MRTAIKKWFREWAIIDVVAFGLGMGLTYTYIRFSDDLPDKYDTIKNVWANLGSEILGAWISVRIIDALISGRDERQKVRSNIARNLTFMVGVCKDMPPNFYTWRANDLEDEIRFFRDKQTSPKGRWQLEKFITKDERTLIEQLLSSANSIHASVAELVKTEAKIEQAVTQSQRWADEATRGVFQSLDHIKRFGSGLIKDGLKAVSDAEGHTTTGFSAQDIAARTTAIKLAKAYLDQVQKIYDAIKAIEHLLSKVRKPLFED